MCTVVAMSRNGFAIGTEVGIMADGALVPRALDVSLDRFASAKRAIAVDAIVYLLAIVEVSDRLKQCGKPVAWMDLSCTENAARAVIKIWAAQAFVTNSIDVLWKIRSADPAYF